MNYYQLLAGAREALGQAGKPPNDGKDLLLFMKNWSLADYLSQAGQEVPAQDQDDYRDLVDRRLAGIPLQEITGRQNFYGYDLKVNPHVLTPRPETELLVDLALKEIAGVKAPRVLDLCTGSGCIAIAMAGEHRGARLVAVDISDPALGLARENGHIHGLNQRISWQKSDLFQALSGECFDVIISNPPYIPHGEIEGLDLEVRAYDPMLALDGGPDGLDFYRQIADQAGAYLKAGGKLFLEIGADQAGRVVDLLSQSGWVNIRVLADYTGRDRMVLAEKRE